MGWENKLGGEKELAKRSKVCGDLSAGARAWLQPWEMVFNLELA